MLGRGRRLVAGVCDWTVKGLSASLTRVHSVVAVCGLWSLTRKLSVVAVTKEDGLQVIFKTLEASALVQGLSGQRGERAQREFLQCKRAPHESLDSYLMRVEAQRDLMLEDDIGRGLSDRPLLPELVSNTGSNAGAAHHPTNKPCWGQGHRSYGTHVTEEDNVAETR